MQVDEALVHLELVAVPRLRALTTGLHRHISTAYSQGQEDAHRLASGDLEHLGRHAHGALHADVLVLRAVDEIRRDCPTAR